MADRNENFQNSAMTHNNRIAKALRSWATEPNILNAGLAKATGIGPDWVLNNNDKHMVERGAVANTLLHAVGRAKPNTVTLYRGYRPNEEAQTPLASYTTDRSVAEKFAKHYGGEVREHKPGTIRAVKNWTNKLHKEAEWVGERPEHPYWKTK